MDKVLRKYIDILSSDDGDLRYQALEYVMAATNQPVDWAYEVWDDLLKLMSAPHIHHRAIATTLLCNLAKSDPKRRILKALPAIMVVTHDTSFVTARHTIQALWKIGAAGKPQQKAVLEQFAIRFAEAAADKHTALTRSDLLVSMHQLYEAAQDESIRAQAEALIATETDPKALKKYQTIWKKKKKA